jgi:hypothetical protein
MLKEKVLQVIKDKNEILVQIKRSSDWNPGLDFITSDDEFLQAGTWLYDKGKKLDRHRHNIVERSSNLTQECIVVLCGSLGVQVYNKSNDYICKFQLDEGDFAVFLGGGHSYEVLSDGTRVLETKNGPFLGVNLDKTRF